VHNFSDAPVKITKTSFSLAGYAARVLGRDRKPWGHEILPDESCTYNVDHGRWPELPRGPFEGTLTVETDGPGYERIVVPVTGVVENVVIERDDPFPRRVVERDLVETVKIWNCTPRPLTIKSATCAVPGVTVSLPEPPTIKAQPRQSGTGCPNAEIRVEIDVDEMPKGPVQGTLTIETDSPGYERVVIPVETTVVK
jgi:hypothetical protein